MTRVLLVRERAEDELMAAEKGLLLLGPQLRLCSAPAMAQCQRCSGRARARTDHANVDNLHR